ncbi:MAG: oligosaccharide flippase family protein [Chloroflexi bacterium]|nr:oligosaccharide flippase family protein [Chloroflexota bacterium]
MFDRRPDAGGTRLMRNTVAPIMLNLFNRGIDFAFASVMFRILGPERAGEYYYAIVIFGWFDIFTNFGPRRVPDPRGGTTARAGGGAVFRHDVVPADSGWRGDPAAAGVSLDTAGAVRSVEW